MAAGLALRMPEGGVSMRNRKNRRAGPGSGMVTRRICTSSPAVPTSVSVIPWVVHEPAARVSAHSAATVTPAAAARPLRVKSRVRVVSVRCSDGAGVAVRGRVPMANSTMLTRPSRSGSALSAADPVASEWPKWVWRQADARLRSARMDSVEETVGAGSQASSPG